MRKSIAILAGCAAFSLLAASSPTWAQAKTAKACRAEWRADKVNFQAKGIAEKAYVAQCRAGTTTTTTAPTIPAPAPTTNAPGINVGQQKTAKACVDEWRADKANFQAKGITQRAYVAQCRSGTTITTATPPPPAPANPAPSTWTPSAAGQYATENEAKFACPGDTVVWVNLRSKIYHFAGTHNYGITRNGAYMCERDTAAQGMRAAKNEHHP